jgi:pyruvate dehydrogenase E2 component (dihydrolipoamide acetyltransferase)
VIEIEVSTSGVIETILVQPGEKVPVGTALAILREEGALTPPAIPADLSRVRISPSTRQLAETLGVDVTKVQGTGRGGTITREDVARVAAGVPPAVPAMAAPLPVLMQPGSPDRAARMRQATSTIMSRSKREIPHYYLSTTIDMHRALTWLAEANLQRPVTERLLYGVLLFKAVALALRLVPELNAVWVGDRVMQSEAVHLGVAISLCQGGQVAPALHNADRQSLDELMRNYRDLVMRTRSAALRGSELADPTITVTSLGEQGVEAVFGIIYPPQVALVGFGKVVERPWVVDGSVVPRPVITATLSGDHRVSDGHRGGLFLAAVERLLQQPNQL